MTEQLKLVHDDGKVPSIFFPAGKPPKGSCEFATKICLERCPSDVTPNALEQWIYEQFKTIPADELVRRIHMELLDRNKLFLQWFPWGDCPKKMTEKVAWIMKQLKEERVVQCGFTRNEALWEKVRFKICMGLTVEDKEKVLGYCERSEALIGWPDYETGKVHLYRSFEKVKVGTVKKQGAYLGSCGGTWHEDYKYEEAILEKQPNHIFEASCDLCAKHKRGCFAQRVVKAVEKSYD